MMSTKELARLAVIKGAIDGACTVKQAVRKLGMSTRWLKHLKKAAREQGGGAVIHGNAGGHPVNAADEAGRKKIVALKKSDKYGNANFTRFRELLEEYGHIKISYTGLSAILRGAGIASPKTRRSAGERRTMRERRAKFGEPVQTDAAPFDWFGLGTQYALHGFQDDAAGDILRSLCANTKAFRGILRRLGRSCKTMECRRPCMPTDKPRSGLPLSGCAGGTPDTRVGCGGVTGAAPP